MEQRTLLIAGIVGVAALAAGWRSFAAHPVPAVVPAPNSEVAAAPARPRADAAAPSAPAHVVVYVAGEVLRPGVYTLPAGARAGAALAAAGGATGAADLVAVNLAEHVSDGQELVVPPKGAAEPADRHVRAPHAARARFAARGLHGRPHKAPPPAPVDLNAAGEAELERLPGIGPSLAERIVAFREANGRFARVDDLLDVAGMNERRLEALLPYVRLR
jgi:competence protein ComEA